MLYKIHHQKRASRELVEGSPSIYFRVMESRRLGFGEHWFTRTRRRGECACPHTNGDTSIPPAHRPRDFALHPHKFCATQQSSVAEAKHGRRRRSKLEATTYKQEVKSGAISIYSLSLNYHVICWPTDRLDGLMDSLKERHYWKFVVRQDLRKHLEYNWKIITLILNLSGAIVGEIF